MSEKKDRQSESAELRRRAEELINEAEVPGARSDRHQVETLRLLHELQVHRIELEMQNAELHRTRDEVETVLEKYTDLYDFAPVGYFTLDRKGTIRNVNLTGACLLGVERSRLVGRRFAQVVAAESRAVLSACLDKVFTGPAKEACEVELLKEGNAAFFAQINAVAAASGQECRIALIDITGRKQAEEALRQAKESAEATARVKSQFLANMSHELRTPMTGMLGMLQLALQEELAPAPREYLETTVVSANALILILNDILDMAKIETGKLAIVEQPFSPRRCITGAVDIITPEVRRKGLAFAVSVTEELPDRVVGDQARLRQVLINLVGNVVKFTEAGKVEVRVTAGRTTGGGKREFTFAVTDTGIGIPDDKKELIFGAFSQVDSSHSRRHGGTGLGLAISRELVELMEGTIAFESTDGVGSTFSFTVPLAEAEMEDDTSPVAETPAVAWVTPSPGVRSARLLLAEDDPVNRKLLGEVLTRFNYRIDLAADGLEALEMWEKGAYDLILMDVQMPRCDGFEAARAIREKERVRGGHTPIIAVTGHAFKEDEQKCLAAGMDAFISKPIDFMKCRQLIADYLQQR